MISKTVAVRLGPHDYLLLKALVLAGIFPDQSKALRLFVSQGLGKYRDLLDDMLVAAARLKAFDEFYLAHRKDANTDDNTIELEREAITKLLDGFDPELKIRLESLSQFYR